MMIKVHACGKTREYPEGTPLFTVAEEFQPEFQEDILLARVNGKLVNINYVIQNGDRIADEGVPDRISDLSGSGGEKDV